MTLLTRLSLVGTVLLLGATFPPDLPWGADAPAPVESVQQQPATGPNTPPELPRARVDVTPAQTTGRTIRVAGDGNLQNAINEAKPGDRIELAPGATYRGPFQLPRKEGQQWIVITTSSAGLPRPGRHVDPSHAAMMPKLVASTRSVFKADTGAHHYRLIGLEIAPVEGVYLNTLVELGDDEKTAEAQPHHFIIERSYLHGDPKKGARRGVALNSRHTAVIDSYLSDFKEVGADSQAIGGWNGAGPFRIAGNYLEGAGENVMFGGADPTVPNLVPADIEIVRNHFAKPLRWKKDDPSFEGTEWAVKNLFELKNARRVLVDGNLFEYNWPAAQNGFSILFTVRNQDGKSPWSTIEDVTFTNNLVRHVAAGVNILGRDDNHPSQQVRRIAIRNNVFLDVGGNWGNGRLFQLLDGAHSVAIDHNTAFQTGSVLFGGDHAGHTAFVFQNNIVQHNEHGITGSGTDIGNGSLARFFPGAVVRRNVFVGGPAGKYPADNFFPASLDEVGALTPRDARLRITLARPFAKRATDGRDPGADIDAINKALSGIATVGVGGSAAPRVSTAGITAGILPAFGFWPGNEIAFWTALGLLFYVYAGYPLLAALRAWVQPKPRVRAPIEPTVTIVVVAHNEAGRIAARIENLLALDYPRERMDILIGSDGSTDGTAERARGYEQHGVAVHAFPDNRGKPAVLNALVPLATGEIVVFADARQRFEPDALRALVANFADPAVGGASGELMIKASGDTAAAGRGTALYWRYEKFIRATEGRADSMVGATGAIYAIRRALFEPIPDDTILDDVLVPMRIVRRGYRVVFEPGARAYDGASATARQELVRKSRTQAGTFQLFAREAWLLNPFSNRLWFETVSHKALRLALPVLHLSLLVANLGLMTSGWFYQSMLAGQLAFYAAALVGYTQLSARRRIVLFSVPCAICLLSWTVVVGFVRFVTNRQQVTWERVSSPTVFS